MVITTENPDLLVSKARIYRPGQRSEAVPLPFTQGRHILAPGALYPATRAVLPALVAMCRRIVPWVTITLAPRIFEPLGVRDMSVTRIHEIDGIRCREFAGLASPDGLDIRVAIGFTASYVFGTAAHECWHALEKRISDEWIARIDADLSQGTYADGLEYIGRQEERRARAFEFFVCRILEGMPARFAPTTHAHGSGIDEIFSAAFTGQIAGQLIEEGEIDGLGVGREAA